MNLPYRLSAHKWANFREKVPKLSKKSLDRFSRLEHVDLYQVCNERTSEWECVFKMRPEGIFELIRRINGEADKEATA